MNYLRALVRAVAVTLLMIMITWIYVNVVGHGIFSSIDELTAAIWFTFAGSFMTQIIEMETR